MLVLIIWELAKLMTLKDCIKQIIQKQIPEKCYFDTHTILNLVFENPDYHLAYLTAFHEQYSNCTISQFHGHIAKDMIASLSDLVVYVNDSMFSQTVYGGKPLKNCLWCKK